jgi:hypothetical protein
MDKVELALSGMNKGMMINLLLSSGFTVYTSYLGKNCYSSNQSGATLLQKNPYTYNFLIFNILLSIFLFADNAIGIFGDATRQNYPAILPRGIMTIAILFNIISTYYSLQCYNKTSKKPDENSLKAVNFVFGVSAVTAGITLFLLRNLVWPVFMLLLGLNSILSTYLANKCYETASGKQIQTQYPLNKSYLDGNFIFSIAMSILILLQVMYNFAS